MYKGGESRPLLIILIPPSPPPVAVDHIHLLAKRRDYLSAKVNKLRQELGEVYVPVLYNQGGGGEKCDETFPAKALTRLL